MQLSVIITEGIIMIIEYKDGTRVVLQLGDMYGDPSITTVCWIEISGV